MTASAPGYIPSTSTVTVGPAEATQVCLTVNITSPIHKNMRHWGNLSWNIFGLKYSQYMLVFSFSLIFTWKEHQNKTWKASPTRRTSHPLRPLWNLDLDETQIIIWTHTPIQMYKHTQTHDNCTGSVILTSYIWLCILFVDIFKLCLYWYNTAHLVYFCSSLTLLQLSCIVKDLNLMTMCWKLKVKIKYFHWYHTLSL